MDAPRVYGPFVSIMGVQIKRGHGGAAAALCLGAQQATGSGAKACAASVTLTDGGRRTRAAAGCAGATPHTQRALTCTAAAASRGQEESCDRLGLSAW